MYCSTVGSVVFKRVWKELKGVRTKGSIQTNNITRGNKAEPTNKKHQRAPSAKRLWLIMPYCGAIESKIDIFQKIDVAGSAVASI